MPPLPSDPEIAGLCDDIYRSAISPEMWETLPGRLAAVAGGGSWALQLVRPGPPWHSAVHGVGFDPDLLALYPERYAAKNPWLSGLMRMPALQLIQDSQVHRLGGAITGTSGERHRLSAEDAIVRTTCRCTATGVNRICPDQHR